MKILLAGASGVLGRSLVPLLTKAGHKVIGMCGNPENRGLLISLGARPLIVDVFDDDRLLTALREEKPDVVIDQLTRLGKTDYVANNRVRIEGTRNLVEASIGAGVKRMVAQSFCLYAPAEGPARETDPLDRQSGAYGNSIEGILAMEETVAKMPEYVILRYANLYGPGTWFAPDGLIAEQIRQGKFAATSDITSFVYVEDAALAALEALAWPKGTVNIADDEPAPATEWAPVFAMAIGIPPPPVRRVGGSRHRGVSNAKARGELGWKPKYSSWRQGFVSALAQPALAR